MRKVPQQQIGDCEDVTLGHMALLEPSFHDQSFSLYATKGAMLAGLLTHPLAQAGRATVE